MTKIQPMDQLQIAMRAGIVLGELLRHGQAIQLGELVLRASIVQVDRRNLLLVTLACIVVPQTCLLLLGIAAPDFFVQTEVLLKNRAEMMTRVNFFKIATVKTVATF